MQELSLKVLLNVFDQLREMGIKHVRISGGEPTRHPEFAAIVAEAKRRKLWISINTHGVYSTRLREQIANLPIGLFVVSLDGLRDANDFVRGDGVFDRAVDTARWLRGLGKSVVLGVHLSRSSVNDVAGLIALTAELGVKIKFSPLRPIGRAREHLRDEILSPLDFYNAVQTITRLRVDYPDTRISTDFDILRPIEAPKPLRLERAVCPAGRNTMVVNYDGYVYPCAFLITAQQEFAAGHLQDAPLLTLWRETPAFLPLRTLQKDAQCQSCFAYGQTCTGGCLAMSYFSTGRLDAHDPTCFIECLSDSDLGDKHNVHE